MDDCAIWLAIGVVVVLLLWMTLSAPGADLSSLAQRYNF